MAAYLEDLTLDEVSLVDAPANKGARVLLWKGATKSEAGENFPASDYAYAPDRESPSTWKLRLTATPGGPPDRGIVGAAVAALGAGFRGNKVSLPADALASVKARVRAAWLKANSDKDESDLPAVLKSGADDAATLIKHGEAATLLARLREVLGVGSTDLTKAEEDDVTNAEMVAKLAELEKANEALTKTNAELTKAAADRAAVEKCATEKAEARKTFRGRLPVALQPGYDALADADKDAFEKSYGAGAADPIAKAFAAAMSGAESVTKENAALKDRISKLEQTEEFTKIRAELAGVKGLVDVEKTVGLVAKLRKSDPSAAEELVTELKAGAARLEAAGLFKTLGRDNGAPNTAEAAIEKRVAEIRKAQPELTEHQAYAKALKDDPKLYEATLTDAR